jgi:hypothetical protein
MPPAKPLSDWSKFWIGFAGGLTPHFLGLAVFCSNRLTYEALPTLVAASGNSVAACIYAAIGGLISWIMGEKELDRRRLFVFGMGAPAIIFTMLTNIESGLRSPPQGTTTVTPRGTTAVTAGGTTPVIP